MKEPLEVERKFHGGRWVPWISRCSLKFIRQQDVEEVFRFEG